MRPTRMARPISHGPHIGPGFARLNDIKAAQSPFSGQREGGPSGRMEAHRILIIDDHEATRKVLRSILRRKGYEVTEAGTIAGGLALLDLLSPPPVCVVLDMDLPDGRGETVLRAIREGHMPVRVAVCSGMSDPS